MLYLCLGVQLAAVREGSVCACFAVGACWVPAAFAEGSPLWRVGELYLDEAITVRARSSTPSTSKSTKLGAVEVLHSLGGPGIASEVITAPAEGGAVKARLLLGEIWSSRDIEKVDGL
jgi:hypothetical protein